MHFALQSKDKRQTHKDSAPVTAATVDEYKWRSVIHPLYSFPLHMYVVENNWHFRAHLTKNNRAEMDVFQRLLIAVLLLSEKSNDRQTK